MDHSINILRGYEKGVCIIDDWNCCWYTLRKRNEPDIYYCQMFVKQLVENAGPRKCHFCGRNKDSVLIFCVCFLTADGASHFCIIWVHPHCCSSDKIPLFVHCFTLHTVHQSHQSLQSFNSKDLSDRKSASLSPRIRRKLLVSDCIHINNPQCNRESCYMFPAYSSILFPVVLVEFYLIKRTHTTKDYTCSVLWFGKYLVWNNTVY